MLERRCFDIFIKISILKTLELAYIKIIILVGIKELQNTEGNQMPMALLILLEEILGLQQQYQLQLVLRTVPCAILAKNDGACHRIKIHFSSIVVKQLGVNVKYT